VRILFDQGVPVPLRDAFVGHEVWTAYEREWSTLKNGDLLNAAEVDRIRRVIASIVNAVVAASPGTYCEVRIPRGNV
jgi:hypothetical protein